MCDNALKPRVGLYFHTFEDGLAFYRAHVVACGLLHIRAPSSAQAMSQLASDMLFTVYTWESK